MSAITDWRMLEEVVEKAVRRARAEELKDIAEAVKMLAEYMKTGFERVSQILQEHSKRLEEHSKRLEELSKRVARLEVAVGSVTRRVGIDLGKTILNLYRDVLVVFGVEDVDKVEKFVYTDTEGRYMGRGDTLEIDIYIHNKEIFFIEVKSFVDVEDVMWFNHKCGIASKIVGKEPKRKIMISIHTVKEALAQAKKYGIDVIYGELID